MVSRACSARASARVVCTAVVPVLPRRTRRIVARVATFAALPSTAVAPAVSVRGPASPCAVLCARTSTTTKPTVARAAKRVRPGKLARSAPAVAATHGSTARPWGHASTSTAIPLIVARAIEPAILGRSAVSVSANARAMASNSVPLRTSASTCRAIRRIAAAAARPVIQPRPAAPACVSAQRADRNTAAPTTPASIHSAARKIAAPATNTVTRPRPAAPVSANVRQTGKSFAARATPASTR